MEGCSMVRLRILEILEEQNHTKYWLWKQLGMSYKNYDDIIKNKTTSIHFDTLERLSKALDVSIGELFKEVNETIE